MLPALRATGSNVQAGLQQLSARGSRMQLGRTWTALIVAQVAIVLHGLAAALSLAGALTVVAWAFAYAYAAVQIIWPGSFDASVPGDRRTWVELMFLSITTLTSTGLSDVVPVRPHARAAVMLEQIAGMMYLSLAVARVTEPRHDEALLVEPLVHAAGDDPQRQFRVLETS